MSRARPRPARVREIAEPRDRVVGVEIPPPVADPPLPVSLGGTVPRPRNDGELVTSIINPSHRITYGHAPELVKSGGESRMADYSEVMTGVRWPAVVRRVDPAGARCQSSTKRSRGSDWSKASMDSANPRG
jgi:hypothetical protein